jgi:hypothetical protein
MYAKTIRTIKFHCIIKTETKIFSKMSLTNLILITIIMILLFVMYANKRIRNKINNNSSMKLDVPFGPRSYPIVGNLIQLGKRPFETLFKWSYEYGPIFQIKLGNQTVVVLNQTDIIREALLGNENEFAGRPKIYMMHATLKGKGIISSPFNDDYSEHKKFLLNSFNRFGKRRSSLEVNCLQTISETLDNYRETMNTNLESNHLKKNLKNSLSQIASQNILTITFGNRMHDKHMFTKLMDLIAENFKNAAVSSAFNFLPVSRIFKTYILKNVFKCNEFLNDLISQKMKGKINVS